MLQSYRKFRKVPNKQAKKTVSFLQNKCFIDGMKLYFGEMKLFSKGESPFIFPQLSFRNAILHPSESADGKRDNHSKESNTRFMLLPFVFCTTCISIRFCYVIFGCKGSTTLLHLFKIFVSIIWLPCAPKSITLKLRPQRIQGMASRINKFIVN